MGEKARLIKLIEVYSDIAGSKKGASLGIDALRKTCEDIDSKYFKEILGEAILHENEAHVEESIHTNAKYIDKIYLVISRLAQRVQTLRNEGLFPIILAGDHASCAGTMHGLRLAHPEDEIGVIYIDAHADIHSPYTSESGNLHGMPLAMACSLDNKKNKLNDLTNEEFEYWEKLKNLSSVQPAIKPENVVFCAVRDTQVAEDNIIDEFGIRKFSVEEITYLGIKESVQKMFDKLSHCKHIYISFDVDSVDPLYIPGTGTPVHNGLSYEQALQLNLELIKNEKVCCWEMAEINPLYNNSKDDSAKIFLILEEVTKMLIKHY